MYLTSTCQIKTDSGKSDRLILVIDENQCYLKGRIYAHASVHKPKYFALSKQFIAKNMTQIEKSVQSKLQMAEFNKRFSRMTSTMWATNLVLTRRIYSTVG